jgi:hypothetical protein
MGCCASRNSPAAKANLIGRENLNVFHVHVQKSLVERIDFTFEAASDEMGLDVLLDQLELK